MSEYTAEDFKNARFAEHDNGRAAMRPQAGRLWDLGGVRMGDYYMAADGWRPVHETAPLTLDTLREAWENAEVPTENSRIRRGDLVIWKDIMGYRISEALDNTVAENIRVLHRAPQPEPWQALADVLRTTGCDGQAMDPKILASVLYERGVRVTVGDET